MDERRVNDIRSNTSDMIVEPARGGIRASNMETNALASIPTVDVMLPSG